MTGRLIPTTSEQEWLEARRRGITASEIAVVMGLSPWSSPYALYHRKRGTLPDQDDNHAMALGRFLESYVAGAFADRHPEFSLLGDGRQLYAHQDRPWQLATPDRLIFDGCECGPDHFCDAAHDQPTAVLEAKTDASYDGWGDDGSDTIPVHYRCQLLWQMDVLAVPAGFVACLFLHSRQLRIYQLTIDGDAQADLKIMRDTAECFLDDIRNGNPPEPDWRPATTTALKALHPSLRDCATVIPARLAAQYRAACKALNAAKARKALAENKIRARMEASRYAVTGRGPGTPDDLVATRQVYDVREHTRRACTVDKLVPAKPSPKEEPTP